jgi:6-phosphogluconolactonase (cycloisomerase 2 family)
MRVRQWTWLAVSGALFLAGCKGFWDAPATTTTTTTTTTLTSGDFYVLNVATNQVVGLYVNAGTLTALPGTPPTLSAAPIAITVAPNNAFLYVSTLGGIFVYTIASNGELTIGNAGQAISADPAASMRVDATNSWLVEAVSGSSYAYAIQINPTTGALASTTEQTAVLPATTVEQVTISSDNSEVFVAMGSAGTAVIPFNSAGADPFGTVGNIAVKNAGGAALSVAVDPVPTGATAPRLLYIGETVATSGSNTGGLRVFDFATLKEITGSPFAISGLAPHSILPFLSGDYVYVVSRQTSSGATGVIAGFSLSDTNSVLALTALGSTFAAGTNPQGLVEDNTGAFVFAVDYGGNPDLLGYTIDSTHPGYLDTVISSATGTDPVQASAIAAWH